MKTSGQRGESRLKGTTGPHYWKSLDDFSQRPEFKNWLWREFPLGASEFEGVNRRHFLKIMAASFAMAGLGVSGCRRPEQRILPYSRQVEIQVPGVPVYFATSFPGLRENIPLVVETHENRPTKVEGNDQFQAYGGATNLHAQASVLDLYDPDRAQKSSEGVKAMSRARVNDLLASVSARFTPTSGQGLAFLADRSASPTRKRIVEELRERFPRVIWAEYEAVDAVKSEEATERLFGRRLRPHFAFGKARRILSLDADFLSGETGSLGYSRDFSTGRRVHSQEDASAMNRLYQVEGRFSITGGMADHRLRAATSQIGAIAALVAAEVLNRRDLNGALADQLLKKGAAAGEHRSWIEGCAADLVAHYGESIVIAGDHFPHEVHQLVFLINDLLGAVGTTVEYLEVPKDRSSSIQELAEAIENGRVETLVVVGGNPVYNAPADLGWKRLHEQIPEVVRYGYYFDETSLAANYHIAAAHYLESWGDGRTLDGTLVPVQPMILPLFDGMQEIELLARLGQLDEVDPYAQVLRTFGNFTQEMDTKRAFDRFLSDGLLEASGFARSTAKVSVNEIRRVLARVDFDARPSTAEQLEVRIVPDPKLYDGRYTNNGWLQECPDPVTKITWDNVIAISPRVAESLGHDPKTKRSPASGLFDFAKASARKINEFDMGREVAPVGELTIDGVTVRGPIHIQPGLADYTVVLNLGYGRRKTGPRRKRERFRRLSHRQECESRVS